MCRIIRNRRYPCCSAVVCPNGHAETRGGGLNVGFFLFFVTTRNQRRSTAQFQYSLILSRVKSVLDPKRENRQDIIAYYRKPTTANDQVKIFVFYVFFFLFALYIQLYREKQK